jgi:hypothetical protein
MTPRAKVDDIVDYIRVKHAWSVSDFVRGFATAEPEEVYGHSTTNRTKKLATMVFGGKDKNQETKGIIQLEEHLSGPAISSGLLPLLRKEMAALQEAEEGFFGKWDVADQTDMDDINFANVIARMEQTAPLLCGLLKGLMEPIDQREPKGTRVSISQRTVFIASILAFSRAPRLSNKFPRKLGLYLHGMGVKRRVLQVISGLGACEKYSTILHYADKLAEQSKAGTFSNSESARPQANALEDPSGS